MLKDVLEMPIIKKYIDQYGKQILTGIILVAGSIIGFYIYHQYRISQQEQAQLVFSETMYEFNRALQDSTLWSDVELASTMGYRLYSSSSFAPYFLGVIAQAQLAQQQTKKALEALQQILRSLSSSSPFYYLYKTKTALIKIDDKELQDEGLQELEQLATDKKNPQRDEALYCLGAYYWGLQQDKKAKNYWNRLINEFSEKGMEESPWVIRAGSKLELS